MKIIPKALRQWALYNMPKSATAEEWDDFYEKFEREAPIRYFLFKIIPRKLRVWKMRFIEDPLYWIRYRTFDKYHLIDTGLKPGYYDKDYLILHGMFNLLKDYVEIECAACHAWAKDVDVENMKTAHKRNKGLAAATAGLAHLKWASELGDESPDQAAAAKEIEDLYMWWTVHRPARKKLEYNRKDELRDKQGNYFPLAIKDKELYNDYRGFLDVKFKQDEEWHNEDTDQLIRLIKIRDQLWT